MVVLFYERKVLAMYDIDGLFDKREIVGSKLQTLLNERNITKSKFADDAKISRPTLDKLLSGNITNKANFINHMEKVLRYLAMTPAMLMENVKSPYIRIKSIRSTLHIDADFICSETGMKAERLKEIESGAESTINELRDIALCLSTSVSSILGENFFAPQAAKLSYYVESSEPDNKATISGFWGHMGIRPSGMSDHLWYPITLATRSMVYEMLSKQFMVVPSMNNKIVLLNVRNVSNIILLDEACDEPGYTNWDPNISCGEIPQVVYESLDDYLLHTHNGNELTDDVFSPRFLNVLESIIDEKKWDESVIDEIINSITVHYSDGEVLRTGLDYCEDDTLLSEVEAIYNFDGEYTESGLLSFTDYNGAEVLINMDNVSVIELPLAKTEKAICSANDEETID